MPQFKSTYPYAIHVVSLGKVVDVDGVVEADENPDAHFFVEVTPEEISPDVPPADTDEPKE